MINSFNSTRRQFDSNELMIVDLHIVFTNILDYRLLLLFPLFSQQDGLNMRTILLGIAFDKQANYMRFFEIRRWQ